MNISSNAPFFVDNEVIILTKNGIWLADGIEISHEPTRRLFAKSLRKGSTGQRGDYSLHIGRETKKIQVEDTPYFVIRIDGDRATGYDLTLNDETHESLNPQTLAYTPGRLICLIKGGQEEARFLHAPYIDILKDIQKDTTGYYLEFGDAGNRSRISLASN